MGSDYSLPDHDRPDIGNGKGYVYNRLRGVDGVNTI
jgi:hypothetical protein